MDLGDLFNGLVGKMHRKLRVSIADLYIKGESRSRFCPRLPATSRLAIQPCSRAEGVHQVANGTGTGWSCRSMMLAAAKFYKKDIAKLVKRTPITILPN